MSWRLLNSIDLRMLTAIKRSIFQAVITRPISTLDQKVELEASRLGCKRDKFFYLCAFEIAKRLQRQKGRLREPYSDVIESPSPNDHFSIAPGLLYSVPLACTKFSRDNQFPDDVSLRNWLDIIEEAIATESYFSDKKYGGPYGYHIGLENPGWKGSHPMASH
uniref:Uncharacterized protein n=1 Tax=Romanomermis culicivorax TaxID=13658 RepID=A0A915I3D1_ROMCU